jgi:outer membrane protein assembly factor BamB
MRSWGSLLLAVPLLGTALLTTGSAAAGTPTEAAVAQPAVTTTLWPTYHLDRRRSGNDLGEPSFSRLASAWNSSALDGAMYAEPLIDGNNVVVATENNSVYAFNATTGSPVWGPVHLGAPRTANFPCGNIDPLGITGTPVIDGGFLYVAAEVQLSPTSYAYHLAKIDPSTGALKYNKDITPTGMDTNVQQERSALAVSAGNVVIVWGGLSGDCGNYHGYVETVSEATGLEQHQWNDTSEPGGREGGMWGPSGPAVNAAGDIFVTTGNGSSTQITNYDFGDSVLKFSPALVLLSWFAPGPPQTWASLNANDTDLGSIGPAIVSSGLIFAIGKGGRGYLLNQSTLPDNSNPGGGENYSNAVCNATGNAAFGGLASHGSTVFVPCADGIAAVTVDSATAFHRIWYQTSGGGSAAIFAGGLVWTLPMDGGTTLYGLKPGTGQIARTLTLPATTMHFATPAAADGMLFVGAGNRLSAFR